MKYCGGIQFKAKLIDAQGKYCVGQTVTLYIHGVFYDRLTVRAG